MWLQSAWKYMQCRYGSLILVTAHTFKSLQVSLTSIRDQASQVAAELCNTSGGRGGDIQVKYEYIRVRERIRAVARAKFRIHRRSDLTMSSSSPSNPIHVRYFPTFVFMSHHTLTSPSPPHYLTNWYILKSIIRSWWNIFTEIYTTIPLLKDFSTSDESQKFNSMFHPIFPLESILHQFNTVPNLT
jgi:hypothetical protein